jgi:glutathione synthase/RimK-type ligase-like ATP-grasp enzyme
LFVCNTMKPFVFIISCLHEPNVDSVIKRLTERNVSWFRLNTESFPLFSNVALDISDTQGYATITSNVGIVDTRQITSVWNRRHGDLAMPNGLTESERGFVKNECVTMLHSLYECISGKWVNPRQSEYRANIKALQLLVAKEIGLSIPKTLMTNDPNALNSWLAEVNGPILFKPIAGAFTDAISQKTEVLEAVYGHPVAPVQTSNPSNQDNRVAVFSELLTEEHLQQINNITISPVTFQEYIQKDIELRITVVGNAIFAAEIHSQELESTKIDFRHLADGSVPTHKVHQMPDEIAAKLMTLMSKLGLVFGCIDMILTPEGEYVFLEVNPSGQWGWIEHFTEMTITEALVDLLIDGI